MTSLTHELVSRDVDAQCLMYLQQEIAKRRTRCDIAYDLIDIVCKATVYVTRQ